MSRLSKRQKPRANFIVAPNGIFVALHGFAFVNRWRSPEEVSRNLCVRYVSGFPVAFSNEIRCAFPLRCRVYAQEVLTGTLVLRPLQLLDGKEVAMIVSVETVRHMTHTTSLQCCIEYDVLFCTKRRQTHWVSPVYCGAALQCVSKKFCRGIQHG